MPSSPRAFVLIFAALLVACSTSKEAGPKDADATDAPDAAQIAPVFSDDAELPFDASVPVHIPPKDAGSPPLVACDVDASTAPDAAPHCPWPPSRCADKNWLVYYTGGDCVGGACAWKQAFNWCEQGCANGSCNASLTAPAPP